MKKGAVSGVAMIVLFITLLFPSIAMAKVFIVGDNSGWRDGVDDYQAWAADKIFSVGDLLVFRYEAGKDHVYVVDRASFQSCTVPRSGGWSSGTDVVMMVSPGLKWVIGDHCNGGQKFVINVLSRSPFTTLPSSPVPAPSPSPSIII